MFSKIKSYWLLLVSTPRTGSESQRNAALFRLSAELAAALDEEEICTRVVEGLHDTLGYDYLALTLLEEETGVRVRVAGIGYEKSPSRLLPGEGLSERPLLDGQLHYTPDVSQEPTYIPGMGGSEVDVPIRIGGKVLGVLVAESRQLDDFNEDDFEVLTAAALQVGLALENARLLAAERKRADELDALYATLRELTAELELPSLLQAIVERAAALMGATGGELGLYDEEKDEIRIVVSHNLGGDYIGFRHAPGEGAMGRVLESGEPLNLEDYQSWEGSLSEYSNIHATLAVPLKVGDKLVGVFTTVSTDHERRFSQEDLDFLSLFARQASIAIKNAHLYKKAQLEIAERARIEAEILHQKEYFEALFINNPVAVVTADLQGVIVSWNPMAEQLFGYKQEEVVGKNLDDIVAAHEALYREARGYTDQVISTGQVRATVTRTRKDGTLLDAELLALPVVVSGEMVGFIAIYHDISDRLRMEKEIRRQKEYFEALFVNNPVAVITVDLNGKVISWNPAAAKLFGYTQEEAVGADIDDLVAREEAIHAEARDYSQQANREGRVQAITQRNRKDGSLVDVELLALPVYVSGEKVGYIGIYYDISELQEARRQAEAANKAKSTFLANMSHELRTPLNAILGFTQLMDADPSLAPQQHENLGVINRSGEHLLELINSVLEMSKIEAGRVALQEKSFDLYLLLDTLEEMFRLQANAKELVLVFERKDSVPRYVHSDDGKLRQVLMNLIGNAIKFTQSGKVLVRVGASTPVGSQDPQQVKLHFEVQDTGPGIPSEELATIFEPFVQAKDAPQFHEGTGLGLSISRQFVRMLGGEICATSTVGQGSLFCFDMIVLPVDETEVTLAQMVRQVRALEPGQPAYRLLVVEDRETNRQLLVKILQPLGFEVKEAANGHAAIEIWEDWKPHLIWLDMQMPHMDGYETCRRIRASQRGNDTVIIALTATAFEEDRYKTLSAGCDDFLRKPFRQEEIINALEKHLGVRFIYEDEGAQPFVSRPLVTRDMDSDLQMHVKLAALPAAMLLDLERQIIRAELRGINEVIELIRELDEELAAWLSELAENFEHEQILALIDQARQ
ncbi:MAG TPA: PAS domain S-box protein [Anaerolineales bacterium]|nr:PAS domain S-box protein [Anaerolineales bacterium]